VPLSRDYLKVINTDVPLDAKGKPIRHQRVTITNAQNNDGSTDSFHIRGSDSDRVTSTVPNESLPNVSRPSAIECGSTSEKQSTGFPAKRYEVATIVLFYYFIRMCSHCLFPVVVTSLEQVVITLLQG
jgi:hypothetical protein